MMERNQNKNLFWHHFITNQLPTLQWNQCYQLIQFAEQIYQEVNTYIKITMTEHFNQDFWKQQKSETLGQDH